MQHHESRAVRGEFALGLQVGDHHETAAARLDADDPAKARVQARRPHVQRESGARIPHPVDDEFGRVPVAVAHHRAHGAQHRPAVEGDIGDLVTAQFERPRTAPPRRRLGEPGHVRRVCQTSAAQSVVMPPSTANSAPVANSASSLARNTMIPSTSAGEPARPSGMRPMIAAREVGIRRDRRHERGLGVAGHDGVHANAAIGICRRDRASETMDAGLRRTVRREVPALAVESGRASGEDDRPAGARCEHRAQRVLDRQERSGEVDVDRALPHVEIELRGGGIVTEQLHAGVGDHDVGCPALGAEQTEGGFDGRFVGDVHHRRPGRVSDLLGGALSGGGIAVGDHDASTLTREARSDGVADAGSGARDERGLPFEPAHG